MKIEDVRYTIPNEVPNEENFDIETWRKENPMDYIKAMYLINASPLKNEAFKAIYNVTRMHIPDVLFKYYSLTDNITLNESKLETLQQQKIFMSETKFFNDPFDNKGYFYDPEKLKKHKMLEPYNGKLIDDFSAFSKITSLTANEINSMPMWAHYANNHTGFCVSYEIKKNNEMYGCTFPVQYTDQRIDITSLMDNQVETLIHETKIQSAQGKKEIQLDDLSLVFVTSFFCNIKHFSWSYEKEFRCSMGANAPGMPYVPAKPKEIYIGKNCLQTYKDRLIKIARTLHIPIYQMLFDELSENFNLVFAQL